MNIKKHLNPPGSQHVFKTGVNMAIILDVNPQSKIYYDNLERRKLLNVRVNPIEKPHLTLHMINFNYKHPLLKESNILKEMKRISKVCYNETLRGKKLKKVDFAILGKPKDPTFVIKYKLKQKSSITDFRLCLYDKIANLVGLNDHKDFKKGLVHKVMNNKKTFIYSTPDGIPLYGIHEHYHGQSNWKPHISLFKLKERMLSYPLEIGEYFYGTRDYRNIDRNNLVMFNPYKELVSLRDLSIRESNFKRLKISTIGALNEIESTDARIPRKLKKTKKKTKKKSKK